MHSNKLFTQKQIGYSYLWYIFHAACKWAHLCYYVEQQEGV